MKMKRGGMVGKYAPFGYLYDKEKDIIYPDESKKILLFISLKNTLKELVLELLHLI